MDSAPANWPTDLAGLRALMPTEPGRINLNAGTLSPTPQPVFDAATRLRQRMAFNGTQFFWRDLPELIPQAREALADFLHGDAERLLLLPNVTVAMNIATCSVPLGPGDEVLTTDQCYGAMRLAMERRCTQAGATLKFCDLPVTPESTGEVAGAVLNAITPKTKCLLLDHVTSPTGLILPVKEICAACRERGIWTIVDGAHGPGMIETNLREIGADYYGANCHKWMMAAPGAGFLQCSERAADCLQPCIVSWGEDYCGQTADCDSQWGGSMWHRRYEYHGIGDRCAQASLPTAIAWHRHVDEHVNIEAMQKQLVAYTRDRLTAAGLHCVSPDDWNLSAGMVVFDTDVAPDISGKTWPWQASKIDVPVTCVGDRRFVRVSCGWFNTEAEIDALAECIERLPAGQLVTTVDQTLAACGAC